MIFIENQQIYLSYVETAVGFGLIVGSFVGSILYTYLGFILTFESERSGNNLPDLRLRVLFFGLLSMKVISESVNRKDQDKTLQSVDLELEGQSKQE